MSDDRQRYISTSRFMLKNNVMRMSELHSAVVLPRFAFILDEFLVNKS